MKLSIKPVEALLVRNGEDEKPKAVSSSGRKSLEVLLWKASFNRHTGMPGTGGN